jgi:DNA repair protein RadC
MFKLWGRPPFFRSPNTEKKVIAAALQVLERRLTTRPLMLQPDDVKAFLRLQTQGLDFEVFCVAYLDVQGRLIEYERVFRGTLISTPVFPREIVKAALANGAAAVVLHHNHPSGSVQPSRADSAMTVRVTQALELVDVRVVDHIITSDTDALSMAERGLL